MNTRMNIPAIVLVLFGLAGPDAFGKEKPKDPTGPNHDLTKEIDFERMSTFQLGPIGARGWMYVKKQMTKEARQILITEVDEELPAAGILQVGDVILGAGEKRFNDDARRCLGRAIDEAEKEENKGILKLTRWRPIPDAKQRRGTETEVELKLRVMGTYSDTAPFNCPKSKKIMEEALVHVMERAKNGKFGRLDEGLLALMAVGKPECMEIVRKAIHSAKWAKPDLHISVESGGKAAWGLGMHTLIMTEYYLGTGDRYVLPAIKEGAIKIAMGQSGGGLWGHGFAWKNLNDGKLHGRLQGYGGLNLAGLPCFLSMIMAKKCGIQHAEIDAAIERSRIFFEDFVGRGTIGYGYHRPSLDHYNCGRNGFSSNGKNSIANIIFTLLGDKRVSNYYSMLITSSYDEREYGHAGNSFNVFWGMIGAACGGPKAVAAFQKELRWYNALTRKGDGTFLFQQLGGYYGGRTLDLEAAHVLANALPLRKLYITGKNRDQKIWLNDRQVQRAIDAGRWHWADYDKKSGDELIQALDCWSAGAREWIAEALGRKGDFVKTLMKAAESESPYLRAGACTALGYQKEKAAPAVDTLVKALLDDDSIVRVAAAYALMRVGKPARRAIPDMLKAVINMPEEGPLQPSMQAIAFSLGSDGTRHAPLYFTGIFASTPEGENPLDGVDRGILYPAIAKLSKHRSGRIRGCGVYCFRFFNLQDVKNMAQEIYDAAHTYAPDFVMFSERPRCRAMELMARFRIIDPIGECADAVINGGWGGYWRDPHHFLVLQQYGSLAKSALPLLKKGRVKRKGEKRIILEQTINAIENDTRRRISRSLMSLVVQRVNDALKDAKGAERAKLCRELMKEKAHDYFQQAAALREIVAIEKDKAFDDVLSACASDSEILRNEAVYHGSKLAGVNRWKGILKDADADLVPSILRILTLQGDTTYAEYIDHGNRSIRLSAVECAGKLGGKELVPGLFEKFAGITTLSERAIYEKALCSICERAKDKHSTAFGIISAITDKDRDVSSAAYSILTNVDGAEMTAAIYDAMKKSEDKRLIPQLQRIYLQRVIAGMVEKGKRTEILKKLAEAEGKSSVAREAKLELEQNQE